MSFNLQLFLLFLKITLRYGLLGFTLSMFLDILIIIFLYSSLHNRHLMSQARRTRHFERSAQKEGRRKIKPLLQVHFSGVFLQVPESFVFWSLGISLYLELFCFLSFITIVLRNLCSGTHRKNLFLALPPTYVHKY